MSLCSTYVRAVDGQLYRDPVLRGPDWFICFDDDDPPEIVVAGMYPDECEARAHRLVASIGENVRLHSSKSSRQFGKTFQRACAFWFDLTRPIPVPEGALPVSREKVWGVIYDPQPAYPFTILNGVVVDAEGNPALMPLAGRAERDLEAEPSLAGRFNPGMVNEDFGGRRE